MTFVIAQPCIGVKDAACVDVCPASCIFEADDQYYINPEACIDCATCVEACPTEAIFPADLVPRQWVSFVEKNRSLAGLDPLP